MRRAANLLLVVGATLATLAALEGMLVFLVAHPAVAARVPRPLRRYVQQLYLFYDRPIPQFDERNARFDPGLFYTLRPGRSRFTSREFDVELRVDPLGVRDDEESLHAPEMVVLGDSYAMGWGVAQDETFPQLIERRTGKRVLDAGVPSYGTVREMKMLDRIDTSRLKQLVIQYCHNDLDENYALLQNRFHVSDAREYAAAVGHERNRHRYWLGEYLWHFFRELPPDPVPSVSAAVEARAFVNAVLHAGTTRLDGVSLSVVTWEDPAFAAALEAERHRPDAPALIRDMRIVVPSFTRKDFFQLDDHWTRLGHQVVADAVMRAN